MISTHLPTSNPAALARGWSYPWSADPTDWQSGQTESREATLDAMCQAITSSCWSPARFEGGHRLEANFLSAQVIALDFDEGRSLDWAIEKFARLKHIIGTTKSHGVQKGEKPPCDRFRVVLFLPHIYTHLPLYKSVLSAYVELVGADKQVKDGARFFYPCRDIISVRDGYTCPQITARKNIAHSSLRATHRIPTNDRNLRSGCRAWQSGAGFEEGSRNISCFKAACDLFEAGWTYDKVVDWLLVTGTSLPRTEVETTVRSAEKSKRGAAI